ncbi:huntingtin-associated protein 40 kDa [Haematobia irritans]|uniref:huntingtin-associated protein 40 kDa n=1 Tax=Haematobia irritans TaxID=7368 RepID=UPI003F4F577E
MDNSYPKNLVDQYLKTSSKLKKIEKAVFKRFGPNVSEVMDDYGRLAITFEEAGIYQYAAMCQLGVAKCENYLSNSMAECQALLKAARLFLKAHEEMESLLLRSNRQEYRETALHCFTQAVEKSPDDSVIKAAIIREMSPLQPHYEGTSSFNSPAHRIYELELATEQSVINQDFLTALQQMDDIVDNIYERKKQNLYQEVLARAEIFRVLLLVALTLPPARQTPAHIKLIEFYTQLAEFQLEEEISPSPSQSPTKEIHQLYASWRPGLFLTQSQKYALCEIVLAWHLSKPRELKVALQEFRHNFCSLTDAQRFLINCILEKVDRKC